LLCAGAPPDDFAAASRLLSSHQHAEAAAAFARLARAAPDHELADDALFAAAELAEEQLAAPERALGLYQDVISRWPDGRLAARAQARVAYLGKNLAGGAAPLAEYRGIERDAPALPPTAVATRLVALLERHPGFPLADQARFRLATLHLEARRWPDALRALDALAASAAAAELANAAEKLRGDVLLAAGDRTGARAAYGRALGGPGPAADDARSSLRQLDTRVRRGRLALGAGLLLALYAFASAFALWRARVRPLVPPELRFYLPVAVVLVGAAATENPAIGGATGIIAATGALVTFLAAQPAPGVSPRALRLAGGVLAVAAGAYLAIHTQGLTDLLLETLRFGPER
jgi:hypothetical protein